ncbi:MAG: flagellar hook basal-body protein [Planctomycetes bacterium]|jgi:flagellar basal-body rod protein FlgF|nr:flagellar hook basal-body protein [Planctomycetota bacterium]
MDRGLYWGINSMTASEHGLDTIASNLANLSVTGYKRQGSATQSFDVVMRHHLERQVSSQTTTDFAQGELVPTGNPYDLAMSGPGFFAIETDNGERYTRNGRFRVDESGTLQTLDGRAVAWMDARGTIDLAGPEAKVDREGVVWQGTNRVGQLKVVDFGDASRLVADGASSYRPIGNARPSARRGEVVQATLESSNVSAVDEMVAMVALQRGYESSSRLLSAIDATYRRLTSPR